jgi:zinc ribbon protein
MNCRNCGRANADDAGFCSRCGTKLTSSPEGQIRKTVTRKSVGCRLEKRWSGPSEVGGISTRAGRPYPHDPSDLTFGLVGGRDEHGVPRAQLQDLPMISGPRPSS